MIIEGFTSGPAETNTYLIGCPTTRRAALIDAPFQSARHMIKRAQALSLQIEMILLTHSHWDHTADAAQLSQELRVPVWVHEADAGNVRAPGSDGLPLYFPIEPVEPDVLLIDGQKFLVGELEFEVIHTPGHTPGGVCFYCSLGQVLFSGDTLFEGTIGRIDFPTASPESMWKSLKRLSELPAETVVYPGHGDPTTIGKEAWIAHAKKRFSSL